MKINTAQSISSPIELQSLKIAFFTLMELLVNTFNCKRGNKLEVQNTPLFLKEKGGAGERENFFSREKKFFLSPAHTLIKFLSDIVISQLRFFKCGDKLEVQNTPLFLKKGEGLGEGKNCCLPEQFKANRLCLYAVCK